MSDTQRVDGWLWRPADAMRWHFCTDLDSRTLPPGAVVQPIQFVADSADTSEDAYRIARFGSQDGAS